MSFFSRCNFFFLKLSFFSFKVELLSLNVLMYFTLHRVHLTNKSLATGQNCKRMYMEKLYGETYTYIELKVMAACYCFTSKEKLQVY